MHPPQTLPQKLVRWTEAVLTWRLRRKLRRKEARAKKNKVLDWIEVFLSSAFIVLLINQYFFQAYMIPSGSMRPTLLEQDRIFVNKLVFGPELLPGIAKLPSPILPVRGDIIIFESPEYLNPLSGTFFDIAQRMIFMVTLSLVDIDRDERGNPRIRFLIKRSPVVGGDRARFVGGDLQVLPRGWSEWTPEAQLMSAFGLSYPVVRDAQPGSTEFYADIGRGRAAVRLERKRDTWVSEGEPELGLNQESFPEVLEAEYRELTLHAPHVAEYRRQLFRVRSGIYVPEGWVLPLGDNRDNSRDGRHYGPVRLNKILGQSALRFWPLHRLGGIE